MPSSRRSRRTAWVVAALLCAATVTSPLAIAAAPHDGHDTSDTPRRVGVLVMDHGEPPVYNEDTYWSFRAFIDHLMQMGVIPPWLRTLDLGTVLQDTGCYACPEPRTGATLIDAWLKPRNGPTIFVPPTSDDLPPHHVMPGGPGLGEPDIFEHAGLQVWDEWRRMGGRSPNYDEKSKKKQLLIERLRSTYGADLPIRIGYGIDPRIGGGNQGIAQAVETLVNRDRVDAIVALYHGVGFSDIMQTHMLRHEVHRTLDELGSKVAVRFAQPMGSSAHYVSAIVAKVKTELAAVPDGAPVAVHLSGHGLSTTTCGDYDCGKDAYHTFAKGLFVRTSRAIRAAVDRPGRFGVFSVFADGSEGDVDPDDLVDSPMEGLAERKRAGFRYVIDVPFEFDSNSRDTLIILRNAYRREAPDWNSRYESRFAVDGMQVKIANANGGDAHKVAAFEAVARRALDGWATPRGVPATEGHTHASSSATGAEAHSSNRAPAHSSFRARAHAAGISHATRTNRLAEHTTRAARTHDDVVRAGDVHALPAGSQSSSGVPVVVLTLTVLAGGAGGLSLGRRGAPVWSRIALGAVAIQLAGFAWDGWLHHQSGHPVAWFENAGHVTVLVGLIVAALASVEMVRSTRH